MKKVLLLILIFIISILSVTAYENTFQRNSQIDYKFPCVVNGTLCSGNTVCNVTVIDSNFTVLKNGVNATNKGTYFNVTLAPELTNTTGRYNVIISCNSTTSFNTGIDFFIVTPSGVEAGESNIWMIAFLPALLILFLMIIFYIIGIKLSDSLIMPEQISGLKISRYIRLLFLWSSFLMIPLLIYFINKGLRNFVSGDISYITSVMDSLFLIAIIIVGFVFVIYILLSIIGYIVNSFMSLNFRRKR